MPPAASKFHLGLMRNLTDPIFPGIAQTPRARTRRTRRPLRELRQRINRRAHELAAEAEEHYRAELEAAVIEGAASFNEIDGWRPADQRGLLDQKL